MRIKEESDILDEAKRKQIIQEIEGPENLNRKYEAFKRYQCYKDKTNHYVVELLLRQFDPETVDEMRYALSNISIVRKVVDKLARAYSYGVERSITGDKKSSENLKTLEKRLDVNTALKKTNRLLKLEKNVDLFVKPCPVVDNGQTKWSIKLEALVPYLYDVIEDYYDRTKAMCVILSDYDPPTTSLAGMDGRRSPFRTQTLVPSPKQGDGTDQIIADQKDDQTLSGTREKHFVFWSKNYHFTCDQNGVIIEDANNPKSENPFKVFNHINFALDQDGSFWSEGGDDLVDGAVLINALITHTLHVGTVQGYGQFYMVGENLPRSIKVGPTKAIIAEYKKDEQAKPEMGFLNASPQLSSLQSLIEMYIALYLTTNNLSTSGVSTQLQSGQSLASGIALIIDKAESMEDIQDQRQAFIDREPDMWDAINKQLKTYENSLVDELKGLQLPDNFKESFNLKFNDPTPIMSEAEKLANMKLRQDLGIDSMISMIMKEDPSLDETQAEEVLKKLLSQRIKEKMIEQQIKNQLGYVDEEIYDEEENNNNEQKGGLNGIQEDEEENETVAQGEINNPTVGTTGPEGIASVQDLVLNGAQITSLVDMVEKVAAGALPRDSAVNMIVVGFNVSPEDAEKILSTAGTTFKVAQPNQEMQQGQSNESDLENDQ